MPFGMFFAQKKKPNRGRLDFFFSYIVGKIIVAWYAPVEGGSRLQYRNKINEVVGSYDNVLNALATID